MTLAQGAQNNEQAETKRRRNTTENAGLFTKRASEQSILGGLFTKALFTKRASEQSILGGLFTKWVSEQGQKTPANSGLFTNPLSEEDDDSRSVH